jgi:hypothetical protein
MKRNRRRTALASVFIGAILATAGVGIASAQDVEATSKWTSTIQTSKWT